MVLIDVNVLVYAYREDAPEHGRYSRWLRACIESEQPYGIASLVLSGFLRVVTILESSILRARCNQR